MNIYSSTGDEIQVGDQVRMVHSDNRDHVYNGRFFNVFREVLFVGPECIHLKGHKDPESGSLYNVIKRRYREGHRNNFHYMWEIKKCVVDYQQDQVADESEDLL